MRSWVVILRLLHSAEQAGAFSRFMFSNVEHYGLPGDIFRKLYPRSPHCEFSAANQEWFRKYFVFEVRWRVSTSGIQRVSLSCSCLMKEFVFASLWNIRLRNRKSQFTLRLKYVKRKDWILQSSICFPELKLALEFLLHLLTKYPFFRLIFSFSLQLSIRTRSKARFLYR